MPLIAQNIPIGGQAIATVHGPAYPFALDTAPLFTLTDLTGNPVLGPVTGVVDLTTPTDPDAQSKTLGYTLPNTITPGFQGIATFTLVSAGVNFQIPTQIAVIPQVVTPAGQLGSVLGFPPIYAAFSQPLDPTVTTNPYALSVWKQNMNNPTGRRAVTGFWSLSEQVLSVGGVIVPPGQIAIFTPGEVCWYDHEYTVRIGADCLSSSGTTLGELSEYTFYGQLRPFYCDPREVRLRLNEFSNRVGEEQLYLQIWKASMTCNREVMRFVPTYFMAGPVAQLVADYTIGQMTYAMILFTEITACIYLIESLLADFQSKVNRKTQGLDFLTEVDDGLIRNLEQTKSAFLKQREPYYSEISNKKTRIRVGQKSANWPNRFGVGDASFHARPRF